MRSFSNLIAVAAAMVAGTILASSNQLDGDPSQWSKQDVYRILNNSPWTRPVKMNFPTVGIDSLGRQSAPGESGPVNTAPMTGMGGRGGMNGNRSQRTYGSGSGANGTPAPESSKAGPTEVLVQWQSDLVVRLAMEKKYGATAEAADAKPPNEYLIGLVGLPMTAIGGRAAWADSEKPSAEDDQRIEDHVKNSASLLRPGHVPLKPTKVELDQGRDGRVLIHFPKSDPVEAKDKSVEFRLLMGKLELRKKFVLKDMEYQGKLQL